MKKFILPVLAIISALQFISCNNSSKEGDDSGSANNTENEGSASGDDSRRYTLESAIVTSKITNSMMQGDVTTVLYFDDYGEKEMTRTSTKMAIMGQNIQSVTNNLLKDGWSYSWEEGKTTGSKFQLKDVMDASKMDYAKMSEEMKKEFGVKKVGTETIMRKKCDKYEMNKDGMGNGNFWLWKNIPLKSETTISGMQLKIEVIDLNENPNFEKGQFDVPTTVTFTEMNMPAAKE